MKFYLGTHQPSWLWRNDVNVPLFVSQRTLSKYLSLRPASVPWALDSGGFSELSMYGGWRTTPDQYLNDIQDYQNLIGNLKWCAPQDWMCEPQIIANTGLSVLEHQKRTVANYKYVSIRNYLIKPVVQGYKLWEYQDCVNMYHDAGINLAACSTVGLGSVCRRQDSSEIEDIVLMLSEQGLKLHGFGVKAGGLERYAKHLVSSDSLAWSYNARYNDMLMGTDTCRQRHINCANCLPWALQWRRDLLCNIESVS